MTTEQKGDHEEDFDLPSSATATSESLYYVEPDYNISDVRAALNKIYGELRASLQNASDSGSDSPSDATDAELNAVYVVTLTTLQKIASNLLKQPVNPAHLSINLNNVAVQKKFGSLEGAIDFLTFCGFQETETKEIHTLTIQPDQLDTYRLRIERALVILNKVRAEHTPKTEMEDVAPTAAAASDEPMNDATSSVAPSSVFLANADTDGSAMMEDTSPPVPDEERKPDLEPTYNIAEVRTALKLLHTEIESTTPLVQQPGATSTEITPFLKSMHSLTIRDSVCQVLDTLIKITLNVMKTPVNPQHLRINLANPAVQKKFAQYQGAIAFLRFLGFREQTTEEAEATTTATTPTSSSSSSTISPTQLLILPESDLSSSLIKFSRALSILTKLRADTAPSAEENERRALGPVAREMRVFDMTLCLGDPSKTMNVNLGAVDEIVDEAKADMGLILQANLAERKRVHELARTDVIITKTKQAELKEAAKRKYHKTLVKITFTDKSTIMAPQGFGRFGGGSGGGLSSSIRRGGGHMLGSKQNAADSAAPMETDEVEEKQGLLGAYRAPPSPPPAVALPVAMPVDPSAITSTSNTTLSPPGLAVLPPPTASVAASPPTPPAPELMICAYFRPWETLADLFTFLQSHLVHGAQTDPFYLHLPPNIKFQCGGPDPQGKYAAMLPKTLQSLGLVPAASMYFHYCSTSSAADLPCSIIDSLKPEVILMKEGYDIGQLTALIPTAENKAELEALKARQLAETKERERLSHPLHMSATGGGTGGGDDEDDDSDIQAYLKRQKKSNTATGGKSSLGGRSGGYSLGSSSTTNSTPSNSSGSGSGSAASKRVIPGLFSQSTSHMGDREFV